jgi:hypothetical protein
MLAAIREQAEAEDAARFAVAEHNRNQVRWAQFSSYDESRLWIKLRVPLLQLGPVVQIVGEIGARVGSTSAIWWTQCTIVFSNLCKLGDLAVQFQCSLT